MKNTSVHTHDAVVQDLKTLLDANPPMKIALEASLLAARISAETSLNSDLYNAYNDVFNGNAWPITIEHYYDYLDMYVRLVPDESDDPNYPNAWKSTDTSNGYNQKVYDLLCQFYWLVDQKVPDSNLSMQSFPEFADWLVKFATAWGSFLDTTDSLTKESLYSFKHNAMYNYPLYAKNSSSWTTFNQFFYREFNDADAKTGITPLRPIAAPNDNTTVVAPADCTFKQDYKIDSEGNVLGKDGQPTKDRLKHTHAIGTIDELLANSEYASDFYGGTFVHYFLGPYDYHRFHTPVSGEVLEIKDIQGKVYLNVEMIDGQWDAPDGAEDSYEFTQARGLIIVDGGDKVGKVAILPIGMAQVSGVMMYTKDNPPAGVPAERLIAVGDTVVKGQEFGKFRFGGSDIIMVFEKPVEDLYMFKADPGHVPIHFQFGQTAIYVQ
ncbi:phosphatidylserine decarboxylase precursor [Kordia periserrulae]|uniref:Phosphatidylserine decarboxylase n=1 Tax=Kordia periserrulae TaxID=701523 RepID=A0A2T6C161_9FLAO|nr:phosphatidylserine decarboxylase [Kordia periserrulae]PTX62062.1 phosphatidylserine decarboxylase precursor [Kordia periserrulae]